MTQPDLFDICAKRHRGNPESREANKRTNKQRDRARIIQAFGNGYGLTCDDVERLTGMSHQTCSARFSDMKRDGILAPTGERRPTRTGSMAAIFRLTI